MLRLMTAPEIVGKNVRGYRNRMGISQEDFADIVGLHLTYIGED